MGLYDVLNGEEVKEQPNQFHKQSTTPIVRMKDPNSNCNHRQSDDSSDSSDEDDDALCLQFDSDDSDQASGTTRSDAKGKTPLIQELL